jgi:hypothetical protein
MHARARSLVVAAAVVVALLAGASGQDPQPQEPAWSPPVGGLRGRLVVRAGPATNGTPILAVYLELENVSDVANPIEVPSTWALDSALRDASGRAVPETPAPADILTPSPFELVVPHDGLLRFRVSVSGYAVGEGEGAMVGMESGCWVIKKGDAGRYALGGTFRAVPDPAAGGRRMWQGELALPPCALPQR